MPRFASVTNVSSYTRRAGGIGDFLLSQAVTIARAAGGAVYDPSVMSSLFQDAAGSTPVTASGQAVRRMNDLSGNGYHAIAPSDAARPLLTVAGGLSYLTADGVDDWMSATSLNLGEVWWHVGGWRSDTSGRAAFTTSVSFRGGIFSATNLWRVYSPTDVQLALTSAGDPATINVLTVQQTATATISGRYNGANGATVTPFDDSGSAQGLALFTIVNTIWSSGISGRFYGGAFAPGTLSATDRSILEQYAAARSGVTL